MVLTVDVIIISFGNPEDDASRRPHRDWLIPPMTYRRSNRNKTLGKKQKIKAIWEEQITYSRIFSSFLRLINAERNGFMAPRVIGTKRRENVSKMLRMDLNTLTV